jgi:hypothetical protein
MWHSRPRLCLPPKAESFSSDYFELRSITAEGGYATKLRIRAMRAAGWD